MKSTEYVQILDGEFKYFAEPHLPCNIQNTEEQNIFCCMAAVEWETEIEWNDLNHNQKSSL